MAFLAYTIGAFAIVLTFCCIIVTVIDQVERLPLLSKKLMKVFSDDTKGDLR